VRGLVVVDAWNGRGLRFDPLTGGPPRESPDQKRDDPEHPELNEAYDRPSVLMSAYFTSISQPGNVTYLDGLRDYVARVGDERPPSDRPTAYSVSWIESPIAPSESASLAPSSPYQITRRRLTAKP
jgi:hypothetical protein